MKIVEIRLVDIKPYEKNPRNNLKAIDKVARSIEEFGFKVPMVIDKDNVIVTGHTRYLAAQKLGMEKVPCIMAEDLTEEQIKAYRLADNKTAEFSGWDFELLEEELENITELDMTDFGFLDDNESFSALDDLMEDEFVNDHSLDQHDSFNITFTFDNANKEVIQSYVKENGKEYIVDMILKEAEAWQG